MYGLGPLYRPTTTRIIQLVRQLAFVLLPNSTTVNTSSLCLNHLNGIQKLHVCERPTCLPVSVSRVSVFAVSERIPVLVRQGHVF